MPFDAVIVIIFHVQLRKSPREQETSDSKDQVASDMLQGGASDVCFGAF
jgi:hypothetical protein